jgi:hypothetical protein
MFDLGVTVSANLSLARWWRQWTSCAIHENIASLQLVLVTARSDLDTTRNLLVIIIMIKVISIPLFAFYIFALFGFGAEARKAYGEALSLKMLRLYNIAAYTHGTLDSSAI